ncbi:Gfo/Idh/MocA family protein [Caldicellulosiruptoraceae bacterium PP1]
MKNVKVGIIGTGFIGPAHIEALRRLGFVDIIALADINLEVAKQKADLFNIKKYYGDYKKLLEDNEIQSVHICTPNFLHYEIAKNSLLAGKHVICEKPLAISIEEGKELVEIARREKLVNVVNFNLRFYPLIHHLKKMIDNDELGNILAINGSYLQDWLLYDTDFNWRLLKEYSGNSRAVADIGSHWMDLIEFVTGVKIKSVFADFATFHTKRKKPIKESETFAGKIENLSGYEEIEITTEDYATVLLRFTNGAHGSLTVNQAAAGRKNRLYFEIYGSKKGVAWNSERPNQLWIGERDNHNGILMKDPSLVDKYAREIISYPGGHIEGFPDTIKQMFGKVYKYILNESYLKNEKEDFPTFYDGLREIYVCEAILQSAKNNVWIHI